MLITALLVQAGIGDGALALVASPRLTRHTDRRLRKTGFGEPLGPAAGRV